MSRFINSTIVPDDITKLISGNVSEGRISDIIENFMKIVTNGSAFFFKYARLGGLEIA